MEAQFKVGSVYRNGYGSYFKVVRQMQGTLRTQILWAGDPDRAEDWRDVFDAQTGRCSGNAGLHLIPGELTLVDDHWIARGVEEKKEEPGLAIDFDRLDEMVASDQGLYRRLTDMRGGCRCFISPPCNACVEPITEDEADALGLLDLLDPNAAMIARDGPAKPDLGCAFKCGWPNDCCQTKPAPTSTAHPSNSALTRINGFGHRLGAGIR